MVKVQLWENLTFFHANDGLEKPIIGLLLESTFDHFKYMQDTIKIAGDSRTFVVIPVDIFKRYILNYGFRMKNIDKCIEKPMWQKLFDEFKYLHTNKFDNYKDMVVVIKEV